MPEKLYDRVRLPRPAEKQPTVQRSPRRPSGPGWQHRNSILRSLLRRASGADAFAAPATVEQTLKSARGDGQPLPAPVREQMESGFGASFEGVTVHTDHRADELTRQVDAVAFTHGRDIYFSSGSFAPESGSGQRLLAHELAHVVQQRSRAKLLVGAAYDPAEAEADQVADAVVSRLQRSVAHQSQAGTAIRRQEMPEEEELLAIRRQTDPEEEEEIQMVRRQEDTEEELLAIRRQSVRTQPTKGQSVADNLRRYSPDEEQLVADKADSSQAAAPPTTWQSEPNAQAVDETVFSEEDAFQQGVQAYRDGKLSEALDRFKQARENEGASDSERASAIWNIGRIYQEMGDDRAALQMYRAYLAEPSISEERRTVAQEIVSRMEREQAERGNPADADVETTTDEQAEAAEMAQEAEPVSSSLAQTPTDPEMRASAIYQLGVQSYHAGALRQSLEFFEQVLNIPQTPEDRRASTIWNIGRIYHDMGNERAALTMYRTYLAQPSIPDERRDVAQRIVEDMTSEQNRAPVGTEEEAPASTTATERRGQLPTNPVQRAQALFGLATQAYHSGDFATALGHFQQIMHTEGLKQAVYTMMLFNMGQCYRRLGNNGAAIDMYRGYIQQPDVSETDQALAQQLIARLQR